MTTPTAQPGSVLRRGQEHEIGLGHRQAQPPREDRHGHQQRKHHHVERRGSLGAGNGLRPARGEQEGPVLRDHRKAQRLDENGAERERQADRHLRRRHDLRRRGWRPMRQGQGADQHDRAEHQRILEHGHESGGAQPGEQDIAQRDQPGPGQQQRHRHPWRQRAQDQADAGKLHRADRQQQGNGAQRDHPLQRAAAEMGGKEIGNGHRAVKLPGAPDPRAQHEQHRCREQDIAEEPQHEAFAPGIDPTGKAEHRGDRIGLPTLRKKNRIAPSCPPATK
jgi:hypothetical protein